jgi:peptide/nickel transport system permease protein
MRLFLLRRFVTLLLTLAAASAVVFVVLDVLPGNAAQTMMGPDAAPEAVAELARQLGLDQPAWQRYRTWVQGLLHGDMGESYAYGSPVGELVARLAVTVPLALMAMALAVAMALAAGHVCRRAPQPRGRHRRDGASQLGIAVPSFWLAILLILLFAVQLQWVPAGGFPGWTEDDGGGLDGAAGAAAARCGAGRWCRRRSWRASPARRCSRCCARTSCAPPAPRA